MKLEIIRKLYLEKKKSFFSSYKQVLETLANAKNVSAHSRTKLLDLRLYILRFLPRLLKYRFSGTVADLNHV